MQERRRYVRLNVPLEVNYSLEGKEGKLLKSITKNVSPNGARFEIEKELPKGAILDIAIKIPTSPEPIPIKAKIVWTRKEATEERDSYDAGFEFMQIPEDSKSAFFQYLCNLMYDQLKKFE